MKVFLIRKFFQRSSNERRSTKYLLGNEDLTNIVVNRWSKKAFHHQGSLKIFYKLKTFNCSIKIEVDQQLIFDYNTYGL